MTEIFFLVFQPSEPIGGFDDPFTEICSWNPPDARPHFVDVGVPVCYVPIPAGHGKIGIVGDRKDILGQSSAILDRCLLARANIERRSVIVSCKVQGNIDKGFDGVIDVEEIARYVGMTNSGYLPSTPHLYNIRN